MMERRPIKTTEPISNGIDASSPLPDKLRELERRISVALTDHKTPSELADLLEQTDLAVIAASEHAKLENEKSLDPLQSPDPYAARQAAEDATFAANRLRTLRPRLLAHYRQITAQAEVDAYNAQRDTLKPERDALERELRETYEDAVSKLTDLFARMRAFEQRMQQDLGNPPAGCGVLSGIDGIAVLDTCVLPDFASPHRKVWPPPSNFAAEFVQSLMVPSHPGAAWTDPVVQERRRAEREAERERSAQFHEQAAKAQEDRINKELKERFLARQRA